MLCASGAGHAQHSPSPGAALQSSKTPCENPPFASWAFKRGSSFHWAVERVGRDWDYQPSRGSGSFSFAFSLFLRGLKFSVWALGGRGRKRRNTQIRSRTEPWADSRQAGSQPELCRAAVPSPAGPGIPPLPRALLLLPVPHPAWDDAGMGTGPGCGAGTERGAQGPSQELCEHRAPLLVFTSPPRASSKCCGHPSDVLWI